MKKIILILFLGISLVGCGPSDPEGQFEKAMEYFEEASLHKSQNKRSAEKTANEHAYKWLNKAIVQGYEPAIKQLENIKLAEEIIKAEYEARRLAEKKETEEAIRKFEEEARKIAEAKERGYDFKFACPNIVEQYTANQMRATNKWTNKKIVITGKVKKIDSRYVELSGSKWMTLNNLMVETQAGECLMRDLTNNGMSYAENLNVGNNAKFVCKGKIDSNMFADSSVWFYNCSEFKN